MKITGVRTVLYEYDLNRPIGDANFPSGIQKRADLAVFIDTDEDVEGVTIASSGAQSVLQTVAEVILGENPRSVRGLWERMVNATFKVGNQGAVSAAIAALDCALWDLRAKTNGVPLWQELGATTPRVKAYASGLDMPLSDAELHDYYVRMAGHGVTAGKLKVGLDADADLRRIGIMEQALGGRSQRATLLIDANEYWSPKQAIRRISEIEREFDITWCEEPARRWDYRGLRQVSRAVRAAVATGENLRGVSEFTPLISNEAVDVVQIGTHTTGITGALRVADLAYAFDRPVALMNCPGRFTAHLGAVLPHHLMMEVLDVGRDAVFEFDSVIRDGWIELGQSPGAGVTFDMQALQRHRVEAPDAHVGRTFARRGLLAGVHEGAGPPARDYTGNDSQR